MTSFVDTLTFGLVTSEDLEQVIDLEIVSFPPDEAATPEKIKYRAENASDFFLAAKQGNRVVGFINGTCIAGKVITHSSMSTHNSQGRTLVIHSVVSHPSHRRQGLALWMLKQYLSHLLQRKLVDTVLLLSKPVMLPLYMSAGFQFVKVSDVEHGQETWIELGLNISEHFGINQWQVDAFTDVAYGGNPAAIVLTHGSEEWMQRIAMENNLSETSFLEKVSENRFKLRWFAPTSEVALCGHATLAAAHTLVENGFVRADQPVVFETKHSGELVATYLDGGLIQLEFPATPVTPQALSPTDTTVLTDALSIQASDILFVGRSLYDLIVEVTPSAFHGLHDIKFSDLGKLGGRGVVITTAGRPLGGAEGNSTGGDGSQPEFDFFSRCFFPALGINEDAVTGSAHCALCPYWLERSQRLGLTKETLLAKQQSPRGGILRVRLSGDRVLLQGTAVTTIKGKILR